MSVRYEDHLGDCLYQLNLVLWMLQPSSGHGVKPVLRDAGYKLRTVEPRLPLPPGLLNQLVAKGIEVNSQSCADILIQAGTEFVVVECKRSLFGSSSTSKSRERPQRQARSLILQSPSVLASALGALPSDVTKTNVIYLTSAEARKRELTGLATLSKELAVAGFTPIPCGVLRVAISRNSIVLMQPGAGKSLPARLKTALKKGRLANRIMKLDTSGNDPRTMYYLPWLPDNDADAYSKTVFGNRIRSEIVLEVGPCKPPVDVHIDVEHILSRVTLGIWDRWENLDSKRSLIRNAKELIRKTVAGALAGQITFEVVPPHGIRFNVPDDTARSKIVEAMRGTIDAAWNNDTQLELFPEDRITV